MSKTTLFTSKHEELCPQCQAPLVIRSGPHGAFKGCSTYPSCDFIQSLKTQSSGHVVKVLHGQHCPKCGAELVLRQGKFGMFIGCSHYPDCEYVEYIDKPDETNVGCPQCKQGKLLQRRSRFGKTFYSCERYPDCQFSLNSAPVTGLCRYCHYPLLMRKKTHIYCANKLCGKVVPEP